MNIGFDAKRAFNNLTGLGNYSRTLIAGLAEHFPDNRYVLFTPSIRLHSFENRQNISIVKPEGLHRHLKWYWRSFFLPAEQKKAGLHIYHGLSNELPFGKSSETVKQVVTIHDLIFLKYPQYYSFIDRKIYETKVRHSCEAADKIIAISEQTKRDIIEWFPALENKIDVVYQSCDARFQQPINQDELQRVKNKLALPEKYILYVGTITERKNILNLVKSYSQIVNETDVQLVLAGDGGDYKAQVKKLVQQLGLEKRVRMIEQIEGNDMPALYRGASLFVYPSVYEGFGIPIIEALFSDVPVVTTQGGCFPEAGGPYTCYVNTSNSDALAQAMKAILSNQSLREKMIQEGKNYVQKFRSEVVAEKLMTLYTSVA